MPRLAACCLLALAVSARAQAPLSPAAAQALVEQRRHRLTAEEFARVATATDATALDLSRCKGLKPGALELL